MSSKRQVSDWKMGKWMGKYTFYFLTKKSYPENLCPENCYLINLYPMKISTIISGVASYSGVHKQYLVCDPCLAFYHAGFGLVGPRTLYTLSTLTWRHWLSQETFNGIIYKYGPKHDLPMWNWPCISLDNIIRWFWIARHRDTFIYLLKIFLYPCPISSSWFRLDSTFT